MITAESNKQNFNFLNPVKILIVVSPYYKSISDGLISGAMNECKTSKDINSGFSIL